jgi:hypothetical protein
MHQTDPVIIYDKLRIWPVPLPRNRVLIFGDGSFWE